jgi:hypothetical protein
MNTTPLYIFDLDGTLADLKHRRHFVSLQDGSAVTSRHFDKGIYRGLNSRVPGDYWIEIPGTGKWSFDPSDIKFKPDWDAFHAACVDDTPIAALVDVLACVHHNESDIWIWSGRMDTVREKTLTWLGRHVSPCFKWAEESLTLRMRPAGDHTPDDQLKESWLHTMSPEDRARLVMVFDDRDRVVSMWRRNGVVCAQVAEGDF